MGGKYFIIILILLFSIISYPIVEGFINDDNNSLNVIYGKALLSYGDIPIGALVQANNSLNTTYFGKVYPSGDWQVFIGFAIGTKFTVQIIYENKWYGSKIGILNNSICNMGEIILYATSLAPVAKYEIGDYVPYDSIQFYGFAYGGNPPYSYYWDFDDGNYSYFQNPTHFYEEPGLYDIFLTVEDESNNTENDSIQIDIEPFFINIEYEDKRYLPGDSIEFNGSIRGGTSPFQWYWDFGDGENSNVQSPVHNYLNFGTYKINLTVTDSEGYLKSKEIFIIIHPLPVFKFLGMIHEIHFYGTYTEKFPLGVKILIFNQDEWDFPVIAPLYRAHTEADNPDEKLVTYNAYNLKGELVFHHEFYEEFTITIFPYLTIAGWNVYPILGRAIVNGS